MELGCSDGGLDKEVREEWALGIGEGGRAGRWGRARAVEVEGEVEGEGNSARPRRHLPLQALPLGPKLVAAHRRTVGRHGGAEALEWVTVGIGGRREGAGDSSGCGGGGSESVGGRSGLHLDEALLVAGPAAAQAEEALKMARVEVAPALRHPGAGEGRRHRAQVRLQAPPLLSALAGTPKEGPD